MADILEPGRKFLHEDRYFLAAQVPHSFDEVFSSGRAVSPRLVCARRQSHFSRNGGALE
jgi:hypothetical protein